MRDYEKDIIKLLHSQMVELLETRPDAWSYVFGWLSAEFILGHIETYEEFERLTDKIDEFADAIEENYKLPIVYYTTSGKHVIYEEDAV